jgi:Uma2 family endonuclease
MSRCFAFETPGRRTYPPGVSSTEPRRTPAPTVEEFLELEEASPTKHEYVAGQVYALAGATARHNRIAMNIAALLWNAARNGPCRVYGSDMRLRVGDQAVYYPDVQVVCDQAEAEHLYTSSPCLIVEVLSPSTSSIDLREKFLVYSGIASLRTYVIVFQDEQRVVRHYRAEGDAWFSALHSADSTVPFPCPEIALSVADIYQGLDQL